MHTEDAVEPSRVSTGTLPSADLVQQALNEAHERYRSVRAGRIASYIPALASAREDAFGLCIADTHGALYEAGDSRCELTMQSVSKPFVFALVCQALGAHEIRSKVGVNSTGLAFDSVLAIELNPQRTMNPLVNAGAIATTSLAPGWRASDKWRFVHEGLSSFAGRTLVLNEAVYESETAANQRNRGIALLLESYGRMYFDAIQATDIYSRQCALTVTAADLSVMGATLADGGVNPITRTRVIDAAICKYVLAVLATAGMYERSGDWLYDVGLPGKSGVSGGIVTIAPGKGGLGVFAPQLDCAGNSIRGQLATKFVSERLGLNLFASKPS